MKIAHTSYDVVVDAIDRFNFREIILSRNERKQIELNRITYIGSKHVRGMNVVYVAVSTHTGKRTHAVCVARCRGIGCSERSIGRSVDTYRETHSRSLCCSLSWHRLQ